MMKWGFRSFKPIGILHERFPPGSENYDFVCGLTSAQHGGMTSFETGIATCKGCIENLTPEARAIHYDALPRLEYVSGEE